MIEVKGLCKTYGNKPAVRDVSFTVRRGDILGFLGPNGAGKSTTMKMITGFLRPTAGTAIVGPDRVIAGSDCGFGTFAGFGAVDPDIAYAKLAALAEGAALV